MTTEGQRRQDPRSLAEYIFNGKFWALSLVEAQWTLSKVRTWVEEENVWILMNKAWS